MSQARKRRRRGKWIPKAKAIRWELSWHLRQTTMLRRLLRVALAHEEQERQLRGELRPMKEARHDA